jgi:hypothetical protein
MSIPWLTPFSRHLVVSYVNNPPKAASGAYPYGSMKSKELQTYTTALRAKELGLSQAACCSRNISCFWIKAAVVKQTPISIFDLLIVTSTCH